MLQEVQIPSSSDEPLWRVYRISLVGGHAPAERASCSTECIPIVPATPSTQSSVAVKPSQSLPLPDCCHRPALEAFVRVHATAGQESSPWTLADEQIRSLVKARKASPAHQAAENYLPSIRSEATSLTFRSPALLPRDEADYIYSRFDQQQPASPALSALADLALAPSLSPTSQTFSIQPPRITTPASDITSGTGTETSVSALFDRTQPRRHGTLDSASVYSTSTARSSIALNLESPSTSKLVLGPEIDTDDIPLVDLSFNLDALEDLSEPAGFLEERDVVFQYVNAPCPLPSYTRSPRAPHPQLMLTLLLLLRRLVQKAKKRQRNDALAAASASRSLTPSSPKDSDRRLSITRIRSRQSADTYLSTTPTRSQTPSQTQTQTQRAPRKLRRARSHYSSRREASASRSVLKAEIKTGGTGMWPTRAFRASSPRCSGAEEKTSLTINGTNFVLDVSTECVFADRIKVEEDEYEYGRDGEGEIEGEERGAAARARPASHCQTSLCKIGRFFRAVASRFALRLGLSRSKSKTKTRSTSTAVPKAKLRRRRVASGVSSVSRASSVTR